MNAKVRKAVFPAAGLGTRFLPATKAQPKDLLATVRAVSDMINVAYVRQKEALGLGHAVLRARELVGDEPFAVILSDDVIDAEVPALRQLLDVYEFYAAPVVALMEVPKDSISAYGVVDAEPVSHHG